MRQEFKPMWTQTCRCCWCYTRRHSRRRGYCVHLRLSVYLSVCPRSNRKSWLIVLGRRLSLTSVCVVSGDPIHCRTGT